MSDQIPIGSPPAPPGRHAAPPGWYSDPADRARERYWDGWQWSRNTRASERSAPDGALRDWPLGPNAPSAPNRPPGAGYQPGGSDRPQWSGYGPASPVGFGGRAPLGPVTADGVPLGGWGPRFAAAIIDLILVMVVSQAAAYPFSAPMWRRVGQMVAESARNAAQGVPTSAASTRSELLDQMSSAQQTGYAATVILVALAYYVLLWRFRSATVGQLALGLRVVPAERGQGTPRLGWAAAVVRALVWVVPTQLNTFLVLFWLLDGLWPLWHPRRQALHDLAARTQVIRVR